MQNSRRPRSTLARDTWGVESCVAMASWRKIGPEADRVLASPLLRCRETAAILYRLAGSPQTGACDFYDVPAGAYYASAAAWAQARGVVTGYGDGTFRPDGAVTRQQLTAMLYRYARLQGADLSAGADLTAYPDGDTVPAYAREALSWAVGAGVLRGRADGRLDGGGTASRAELAVLLQRFCQEVLELE